MILPETWVARHILHRQWGIEADLSILSLSDNRCSWLAQTEDNAYVIKAAPETWSIADDTALAWMDAGRLCEHAITIWPTITGAWDIRDGHWAWSVQCWQPGRTYDGTWADAELIARQVRVFTQALATPSRPWSLASRFLYRNLDTQERASVNEWLLQNKQELPTEEWLMVQEALGGLSTWYAEGLVLPPMPVVIIHYDLHPNNCIITDSGGVVFLDPTLAYGNLYQSLAFAAYRFWPKDPMQFLAIAYGDDRRQDWRPYVRRETVQRINFILRWNYIIGGNAWRTDLRKHLLYLRGA